jgi:hypothetical protein
VAEPDVLLCRPLGKSRSSKVDRQYSHRLRVVLTISRQTGVRIWSLRCLYRFAQRDRTGEILVEEVGMYIAVAVTFAAVVLCGWTVVFIALRELKRGL